ncbi:MAG: OmpW family outer membrane protein [Rhodospirillaceae bacterium]|nr:OmpW family outer membrane protein [Rhodospirillaceae bacterium]
MLSRFGAIAVAAALGLSPSLAFAQSSTDAGSFWVRGRILSVMPDEGGTITPIGGKPDAENTVVPEVDFTYFVSDRIALELIAAVTEHDVVATGTTLGTVDLGEATLLPPTLTLQYHADLDSRVSPYVGVGVNYTHFFDADPSGRVVTAISYGDSFGPALQAGLNIALRDNWFVNLDLKKVWINTDVKINGGAVTADVDLDPWIAGIGIGYKF